MVVKQLGHMCCKVTQKKSTLVKMEQKGSCMLELQRKDGGFSLTQLPQIQKITEPKEKDEANTDIFLLIWE